MTEKIEAYFKNEDDAETVHAELNRFNVDNVRIEEIPEDDNTLIVPIIPQNNSGSGFGAGFIGAVTGEGKDDTDQRKYLLSVEIENKDYEQVMSILKDNDAYMARDHI